MHAHGPRAERFANIRHLKLRMLYAYDPECCYEDDSCLENLEQWKQLWRLVGKMRLTTLAVSLKYIRSLRPRAVLGLGSVSIVPLLEIHGIRKAALAIQAVRKDFERPMSMPYCRHNQLEEDVLKRWKTV